MKRNPNIRTRFTMKPLKIELSEAEILADLRYGVSESARPERASRRVAQPR
ncbi:MAG: hypothetical protein J0H98_07565 [Solirubrobacterales bacterium]|nr:hypothetical protein [Solirubrobacterales bacterium]